MNAPTRFVRKNARIYHDNHCLFCGANYGIVQGEPRACRVTTCLACHTPQCSVNGLSHGTCSICYVGLLPGWAGNDKPCRYKDCGLPSVARDGKWYVCAEHLERRRPGYIAQRLAERETHWILMPAKDVPNL